MSTGDAALPFGREPADLAHDVLDSLIRNFRDPAYRVEFFTGMIAVVPCVRMRMPFLPALLVAFAAGKAAGWAYGVGEAVKGSREAGKL